MGIHAMSRRRKIIIIAVSLALLGVLFLAFRPSSPAPTGDRKEPEKGGGVALRIDGDSKLNSLLNPPQFFAAKDQITTYITLKVDPKADLATIETTSLRDDGGIDLKIDVGDGSKAFDAVIYSNDSQFVFSVPKNNYQIITPQTVVLSNYYGK